MKLLVIGGTGRAGIHAIAELARRELPVKVMTRSAQTVASLPDGVEGVVGSLEQPDTLPAAFADVERVYLITPKSPTETQQGLAAIAAARAAGVRRMVYLSAYMSPGSEHIPHLKSKLPIEQALKDSGMEYTILRPHNFFQNDLAFQTAIAQTGLYPQPVGQVGLNRVDTRDFSEAAIHALLDDGHNGKTYPIVGPEALTGDRIAATYSRYLDRDVRYGGDDLDAWAQRALAVLPAWMVADLRVMYAFYQEHGAIATDAELAQQHAILHREPRSFDDFVAEVVST